MEKDKMIVETVKEFAKSKGFVQVAPTVRVNTNGYPFVTFINSKNEAENIYLSKKAAEGVNAGTPVGDILKSHQIGHTKNEAGEARVKLISNSERLSLADLL